jgi:hypothetical protein
MSDVVRRLPAFLLTVSLLKQKAKRKRQASPITVAMSKLDHDYDVRVPNDYNEFKEVIRRRRQAVRQHLKAQKVEEELRLHGGYPGQDEDSEYSEDEGEEQDAYRRSKMGRFAPPSTYSQPATLQGASFSRDAAVEDDEKPYLSPPPPSPPAAAVQSAPQDQFVLPEPLPSKMSGEEAYQRRVAMSQAGSGASASAPLQPMPPPTNEHAAKAAATAAAIAARLAKAAPKPEEEPPAKTHVVYHTLASETPRSDSSSFAERLMLKQGWRKGEAIGAEGNKGMLDPILAERVEADRRRARAGDDSSERHPRSNRGTIVNAQEERRRQEEIERYGTVSGSMIQDFPRTIYILIHIYITVE